MRYMHLHKLHTNSCTHGKFRWKTHENRIAALHINNRTHNAELWLCDMLEKHQVFFNTHRVAHIDFVLLLKCANQKTEHAYQCALFFRFHAPSIPLIRSNASRNHTHMQTPSLSCTHTICVVSQSLWMCLCVCVCIQRKVPFALLHVMHGFMVCRCVW